MNVDQGTCAEVDDTPLGNHLLFYTFDRFHNPVASNNLHDLLATRKVVRGDRPEFRVFSEEIRPLLEAHVVHELGVENDGTADTFDVRQRIGIQFSRWLPSAEQVRRRSNEPEAMDRAGS